MPHDPAGGRVTPLASGTASITATRAGGGLSDTVTFRTLGDVPLAMVEDGVLTPIREEYRTRRSDRDVTVRAHFDDVTALRCRFRDCRHLGDAGCAADDAIAAGALDAARLARYQRVLRSLDE